MLASNSILGFNIGRFIVTSQFVVAISQLARLDITPNVLARVQRPSHRNERSRDDDGDDRVKSLRDSDPPSQERRTRSCRRARTRPPAGEADERSARAWLDEQQNRAWVS